MARRDVLRVGALGFAGLTLADVLRARAASDAARGKSVIMVWLRGGASHLDSLDPKPDAPAEVRGEFGTIPTALPGVRVCEHLPLTARMMDKLAVIRGIKSVDIGDHTPHYILTGFPDRGTRPVFGSVASRLGRPAGGLPAYVSLMYEPPKLYDTEGPTYLGPAHRPFAPRKEGLADLSPAKGVSPNRVRDRRALLDRFDAAAGVDPFRDRAFDLIATPAARAAFDLKGEGPEARDRYGPFGENFLRARRLAEAGVAVVTLKVGDWDTHEKNFVDHEAQLPLLDRALTALVEDLYDRGLEKDVAVVVWGEFGRAPRVSRGDGRDHWPEAGAAVVAGGGFAVGQVVGETDRHGGESRGKPYTPANVLASLYRHLGIDPAATLPGFDRRPMHVLDDRDPVRELG
ncbi:MAG: DUF1501 domain-containing protein [Gemmataceae bacterium]|nr:DUF1501 domain-containing protein [Gemmataceae bacterium]